MMGAHMIYRDPRTMLEYLPYTAHIHGKFYEMLPDGTEYSIPYDEIIPVLIEGGYNGYIDSEYEGNRWIQDVFEVDSTEQLRRHHAMLKRLLGEE
jgi:sugar phosphate isomerase/epimerase